MILCNIAVAAHTGGVNRNQMLYDQCGTQEIADELGVAWSTAKDAVKKVRQLAQEHTGLTRN